MEDHILRELIELLEEEQGRAGSFTRDTRLYEDLNIYGDDAFEFMVSFGKKFNVDLSGFDFNKYFKSEGFDLFGGFFNPVGYFKKPITLGDLEQAVINGKMV